MTGTNNHRNYSFPQKVWVAGGVGALIVVLLLLFRATFGVLLLVLAGTLIAVFFRGLSGLIERKTGWNEKLCLALSIITTLITLGLLIWLLGAKVQSQAQSLSQTLPSTLDQARTELSKSSFGKTIVDKLSSTGAQQKGQSLVKLLFTSTFGVLGDLYVVLFVGIFFTVSPRSYTDPLVKLIPSAGQKKARDVLAGIGDSLKKWLKGKLFAMLVVFILTSIGLLILGVPMWLVLALIAGLLNFIPNFGPLIALIPAVLVAFLQGPSTALWVAGLYILVQVLESNFITPLVQQKLISIPPAAIIIAQMLIAPLTGGWGLVLATPLMVILMVVVKEAYLKR